MTRFHLLPFILISFLLNACTGNQQNARTEKAQNGFVFSNQTTAPGDDNSFCRKLLPDAVVINADPANTNRRLFLMSGGGVYKVTADFGNIVASFALQQSGENISVFTSDNNPECLSNRKYFTINESGNILKYNNQQHIFFDVSLEKQDNSTLIVIEYPNNTYYGITVRK
ncbi:MAG: hypothetical protein RL013_1961 [Bacteroidota bacterium]|jgi:hypothetical protein